jgi:hypothetical protein
VWSDTVHRISEKKVVTPSEKKVLTPTSDSNSKPCNTKMGAACSSKTSANYRTTWRQVTAQNFTSNTYTYSCAIPSHLQDRKRHKTAAKYSNIHYFCAIRPNDPPHQWIILNEGYSFREPVPNHEVATFRR